MKNREPRRRVMLPARMRVGGHWIDVSIRNLSSRGMLVDAPQPVERGAYVEVCRGRHTVVGRAVWRKGRQVGLRSQDRIDMDAIVSRPDEAPVALQPCGKPERRRHPRPAVDAARSALIGAHLQKIVLGLTGLAGAGMIAHSAHQTLTQPFASVREALVNEERQMIAEVRR